MSNTPKPPKVSRLPDRAVKPKSLPRSPAEATTPPTPTNKTMLVRGRNGLRLGEVGIIGACWIGAWQSVSDMTISIGLIIISWFIAIICIVAENTWSRSKRIIMAGSYSAAITAFFIVIHIHSNQLAADAAKIQLAQSAATASQEATLNDIDQNLKNGGIAHSAYFHFAAIRPVKDGWPPKIGNTVKLDNYYVLNGDGIASGARLFSKLIIINNDDNIIVKSFTEFRSIADEIYNNKYIKSEDIFTPGENLWNTAETSPVTSAQMIELRRGNYRIVEMSEVIWRNENNKILHSYKCEWTAGMPNLKDMGQVWHLCDY